MAKKAEATKHAPTPSQPAEASATLSLKSPKYCAICTPEGKLCPIEYPIKSDWPDDSEKEKESQEQNNVKDNFSDIKDSVADLEDQKNKDNKTPQPSTEPTSVDTIKSSKHSIGSFGNQISVSSEEEQEEETLENSLEDINYEVHVTNSVYKNFKCMRVVYSTHFV